MQRSPLTAMHSALQVMRTTQRKRTPGVASVEMALVTPILIVLLFGTIELGLIFRDMMMLNQAAREGARAGAIGASTTDIGNRLIAAAPSLKTANLTYTLQYRTYSSGTWSGWTTLSNVTVSGTTSNSAPNGAQVRVLANYAHQLVPGGLFDYIADNHTNHTMTLRAGLIMRRE